MKTTYLMMGTMLALLGTSLNATAEICSLFACADASASASGDIFSCEGGEVCWSYSASGSHSLKPLSLYAGGVGHLEAIAANSEYVGRDMCIIDIGVPSCGTHVGDNLWHGPDMLGCLQATATTKPSVGDGAAAPAAANCDAPRDSMGRSIGGSESTSLQLTWGWGDLLTDGVRLAPLLK